MRIGLVTTYLPGHFTAGKKITFDIIKGLSASHEVFLVSRIEPYEMDTVKELEKYCVLAHLDEFETSLNRNPISMLKILASYMRLARNARKVFQDLSLDVIQVNPTFLGFFYNKRRAAETPMVLDTFDVITLIAKRELAAATGVIGNLYKWLVLQLVKFVERYTVRRFDVIATRSEFDTIGFKKLNPGLPVMTVRQPVAIPADSPAGLSRDSKTLLFVGAMHRDLNVRYVQYFYNSVLPLIREKVSGVKFCVVGDGPPKSLIELAEEDGGMEVTGYVEDLLPYYRQATVFVSPILIGGGVIVKNLEALSHGLPVVTSTFGNEGIGATDGKELLIADTPEDFAASVVRLLQDEELRSVLTDNSTAFIRKNFNSEAIIRAVEDSYNEAVKVHSGESR